MGFEIAAQTNPVIPGLFALGGVLLGAAINFTTQLISEALRKRQQTASALRLVDYELARTQRLIDAVLDRPRPISSLADDLATPTWEACQVHLAAGLKRNGPKWSSLRDAYTSIEELRRDLRSTETGTALSESAAKKARGQIQKALDAIQGRPRA